MITHEERLQSIRDARTEIARLEAENAALLEANANMTEALLSASKELLEVIGPRVARTDAENATMRGLLTEALDNARRGLTPDSEWIASVEAIVRE